MSWLLWLPLVLILGFAAWVRLSPVDTSAWHVPPPDEPVGDYPGEGSFLAVRDLGDRADAALADLDRVALGTPRTRRIAGGPETGMTTYETRSKLWGFPDYTTVAADGPLVRIYARLRFGRGDMGVNQARVREWMAKVDGFSGP